MKNNNFNTQNVNSVDTNEKNNNNGDDFMKNNNFNNQKKSKWYLYK